MSYTAAAAIFGVRSLADLDALAVQLVAQAARYHERPGLFARARAFAAAPRTIIDHDPGDEDGR